MRRYFCTTVVEDLRFTVFRNALPEPVEYVHGVDVGTAGGTEVFNDLFCPWGNRPCLASEVAVEPLVSLLGCH